MQYDDGNKNLGLTLGSLFSQLTERIHSPEFAADARHFEFPNASTRSRKLPLNGTWWKLS